MVKVIVKESESELIMKEKVMVNVKVEEGTGNPYWQMHSKH